MRKPLTIFRYSVVAFVALSAFPAVCSAQEVCSDGTTLIMWINGIYRTGGNQVTSHMGTQITGDYSDTWEASMIGSESFTPPNSGIQTLHPTTPNAVGYGGNDVPGSGGTAAGYSYVDTPSTLAFGSPKGIGTYSILTSHVAESECGEYQSAEYTDDLVVNQPAIAGLWGTRAFWNLGPGSSDPQKTTGGIYYYQSVPPTFTTNCGQADSCGDTPQWTITTSNNQATLSATSGSAVTMRPGSSPGNCTFASTIGASFGTNGGLPAASMTASYNSPHSTQHINGENTVFWSPQNGFNGYQTYWSISVFDACATPNILLPLPISENFPSGFQNVNGGSGYLAPAVGNADYTQWAGPNFTYDVIGQWGNVQKPPVFFDRAGPPYTGNTVYLNGAHTFNAGTAVTGNGILVYNGLIEYYTDHGDDTAGTP